LEEKETCGGMPGGSYLSREEKVKIRRRKMVETKRKGGAGYTPKELQR